MRHKDSLSQVFQALADPNRRSMLEVLAKGEKSISELSEPISLSLVSTLKHVSVLSEAGLVEQQKTGRVRQCKLEEGPLVEATVWLSKQCKYWQSQFEMLAALLTLNEEQKEENENDIRKKRKRDRRAVKTGELAARKDSRSKARATTTKSD